MPRSTRSPLLLVVVFAVSLCIATLATPSRAGDVTVTLDSTAGFVVENNAASVERLRVDEATGNISRNGALFVHTTGTSSSFVGVGAGSTSSTGARNAAFGNGALAANTSGYDNSAFGFDALAANTIGGSSTAFGTRALRASTAGRNSAFGVDALRYNTTGSLNAALGEDALRANTTGNFNAAFGFEALSASTTSSFNSAFGSGALKYNSSGNLNSAFGFFALKNNTSGAKNSAFGVYALRDNAGFYNSAVGYRALMKNSGSRNAGLGQEALTSNTTGNFNTAVGESGLRANTTGSYNVALGRDAGRNQTTGSDNIYIDNTGAAAESGKIRIGRAAHTETFIEGIDGNTAAGGVAVLINSSNELHTLVSSIRFKEAVHDMGDTSGALMQLRPVTFRYREGSEGGGDATEYGLIAEEVAEVAPDLVVHDVEGKPYAVRYHVLPAMLINEMQKLVARLDGLESELAEARAGTNR